MTFPPGFKIEPEPYRGAISTGSLSLDAITGIGGIPCGRITEIYGPESSSKTTLALHIIREAQKQGRTAALVDTEFSYQKDYAEGIGVDTGRLIHIEPDTGEEALECVQSLVEAGTDVVVLDSIAALIPKDEFEGLQGQKQIALLARLMSQALRKLVGAVARSGTALIFINQIRMQVGLVWGNPEVTPGGRALKFYDALRIEVRRNAFITIPSTKERKGERIIAKITKNKLATPHKRSEFDVLYGQGIVPEYELLRLGEQFGIVRRSGPGFIWQDTPLGRSFDAACLFLRESPEVADSIRKSIMPFL